MKRLVTFSLVVISVLALSAQSIYVPPDYFGEEYKESIGFWQNKGQIINTQGHEVKDVLFYSEGGIPRAYLRDKARISFVLGRVDTIMSTLDTL